MVRTLILLSLLFLSSCTFDYSKNQIKDQITKCWNIKSFDKKYSDSRVLLQLNLNKDGSVDKLAIIESKCDKLTNEECNKFINSAIEAVHKSSPIKHLFVDQYENWKEINLNFDPSYILE